MSAEGHEQDPSFRRVDHADEAESPGNRTGVLALMLALERMGAKGRVEWVGLERPDGGV